MTSLGFNTALTALTTAQQALSVVGHNIANSATPGYSRQRVSLSPITPMTGTRGLRFGRGVGVDSVDRVVDSLLARRIREQASEVGRAQITSNHLIELETIFAEPSSGGLSAMMAGFFSELSGLSATPEDPAARTGAIQNARSLTDSFNTLHHQLRNVVANIDAEIRTEVGRVNDLTEQIARLNHEIARAGLGGNALPSDLMDRQETLLAELGTHVDVQVQELNDGRITVTSRGQLLVKPDSNNEIEVRTPSTPEDGAHVRIEGAAVDFIPAGGRLRGLLDIAGGSVQERLGDLDRLAREFIVSFNRVHSTGVPSGGGFTALAAAHRLVDYNGSGNALDEKLINAGLPFDLVRGELTVNVTDDATGQITTTQIAIDPERMTVAELRDALSAISGITANVDPLGVMRLTADGGKRFDFSNRVPPFGDVGDTFGSNQATITGSTTGPFFLSDGDSFAVSIDGGPPQTVTLSSADFSSINNATASEVVAAINSQITGGQAEVVNGRVVIRNSTQGSGSIQLASGTGTPLTVLGLSTALDQASAEETKITLGGTFSGDENRTLEFVPRGAGTIGSTPGLLVDVYDEQGTLVGTLDVGESYQPGTSLDLVDGVTVAFSGGDVDPAAGDAFSLDLVADPDTSDVLVALGLGAFFTGTDAHDIGIAATIEDDPRLFAGALSAGLSDNQNILRMLEAQEQTLTELDEMSLEGFYERMITELGVDSGRAISTADTHQAILSTLEARYEGISGVNLDEELLLMQEYEQLYAAAARYLQVMQEVNDVLATLVG